MHNLRCFSMGGLLNTLIEVSGTCDESPNYPRKQKLFMGYNMGKHKSQEKIFWTQISRISQIELRFFLDRIYWIN